jgi:hypothetical protein
MKPIERFLEWPPHLAGKIVTGRQPMNQMPLASARVIFIDENR